MRIKKYFLCFLLIYFIFHLFSFLFALVLNPIVFWSAKNLFHIGYTFEARGYGSGDYTYKYIETFWHLCLSFILAFPLSMQLSQLKDKNIYKALAYFFLVLLRVYLAFYMLVYGFSKVFPFQFPPVHYFRLAQPYGESSPMGLAWTFMQYSPYYTAFTGLAEIIGGLLLLHRKTVTLGAVILTGVISNIVMMNFCYDIPVKLNSMHMLLAALILLLNDRKRLLTFFIQNKPTVAYEAPYNLKDKRTEKLLEMVKTGFKLLLFAGIFTAYTLSYIKMSNQEENNPELFGFYEVKASDKPVPYVSFVFETYNGAQIRYTNNEEQKFNSKIDSIAHTIQLFSIEKDSTVTPKEVSFQYTKTKDGLILNTKDTVKIELKLKTKEDFLLTNRGFHWINETPFNR